MSKKKKSSQTVGPAIPPASEGRADAPSWREAKGPALRFVLICGGLMLAFYGVFYTSPEDAPGVHAFIRGYLSLYASAAGAVLDVLGYDVKVVGTAVKVDRGLVEVARGCDAMEPIAFFCAAVLAIQVGWRAKGIGLAAGVALLVLANLLRIIALTLVSMKWPERFETFHVTVGQTAYVMLTLCLWFAWVHWATRPASVGGEG
jgi:exosortase/archaeosortase family protein